MSRCNKRRVRDHVIYVICQSGNFGELDCAKINEVRITPPGCWMPGRYPEVLQVAYGASRPVVPPLPRC